MNIYVLVALFFILGIAFEILEGTLELVLL